MTNVITKYSAAPDLLTTVPTSDRTFTYLFSDSSVDLAGDSVDPRGIDTSRWETNPVILFSHDTNVIVARGSNLRITDNALYGDVQFPPEGTSAFADEVCRLVEAGFLRGISISFINVESEYSKDKERGNGKDYHRTLLLEASLCSLPMNGNALIQEAKSKNFAVPTLVLGSRIKPKPKS